MEHKGIKVSGISFDSRKIKQGMLFALNKENNQYISDALKFGAKAVLCKKRDISNLNKTFKNQNCTGSALFMILRWPSLTDDCPMQDIPQAW